MFNIYLEVLMATKLCEVFSGRQLFQEIYKIQSFRDGVSLQNVGFCKHPDVAVCPIKLRTC
jgi:hypothetical protein